MKLQRGSLSSWHVFAVLGWLYLIQGIPYGLQDKFIPLQLRAHGLDYSRVGLMKAVLVPWVSKGLWAPLLQLYGNRKLWLFAALLLLSLTAAAGSTLDVTEDLTSIACVLLVLNVGCAVQDVVVDGLAMLLLDQHNLGLVNSLQVVLYKVGSLAGGGGLMLVLSLWSWQVCLLLLSAVYLCSAVWAATLSLPGGTVQQEEDEVSSEEQHMKQLLIDSEQKQYSNALPHDEAKFTEQLAQEKAVTETCTQHYSLSNVRRTQLLTSTKQDQYDEPHKETVKESDTYQEHCEIFNRNEKYSEDDIKFTSTKKCDNISQNYVNSGSKLVSKNNNIASIFREILSAHGTAWLVMYVALYKLGERGAINNFPLFLLDNGLTMNELAFWNGSVSQLLSILGSIYGGFILSRPSSNINSLILFHSLQRFVCIAVQCCCIGCAASFTPILRYPLYHTCCLLSLCWLSYSTGVISTLTFTLMMQYSRQLATELQSSHYSILASVEVAGKLAFATVAGALVDYMGLRLAFALFTALSLLPVLLLLLQPPPATHKNKQE